MLGLAPPHVRALPAPMDMSPINVPPIALDVPPLLQPHIGLPPLGAPPIGTPLGIGVAGGSQLPGKIENLQMPWMQNFSNANASVGPMPQGMENTAMPNMMQELPLLVSV